MRKTIVTAVAAIFFISLALMGCQQNQPNQAASAGSTASPSASKPADDQKPVTLRIFWWGSQTRHDLTLKVLDMFKKTHPNVTFEPEFIGFDGYWNKLNAEVAGNITPDILQMDYGYIKLFKEKNVLEDLQPYVGKQLNLSDFEANTLSSGKLDGGLYGIPLGLNFLAVVYDPAFFQKAGVPVPKPDWTWDDYVKAATDIHKALNIYGSDALGVGDYATYYMRLHGKTFYSADGTTLGYDDDQLLADVLTRRLQLQEAGVTPTPDVTSSVQGAEDSLLVHGKSAMSFQWSNLIVAMSNAAKRPLGLAVLPGPDAQKGMFVKPTLFFSISKASKNKEIAAEFLDYFLNDVDANNVLKADRGIPGASKVKASMKTQLTPINQQLFDLMDVVSKNSSPIDPPNPPNASEVGQILTDLDQQVLYKKMSPQDAAKKFRQQALPVLAKNKK